MVHSWLWNKNIRIEALLHVLVLYLPELYLLTKQLFKMF